MHILDTRTITDACSYSLAFLYMHRLAVQRSPLNTVVFMFSCTLCLVQVIPLRECLSLFEPLAYSFVYGYMYAYIYKYIYIYIYQLLLHTIMYASLHIHYLVHMFLHMNHHAGQESSLTRTFPASQPVKHPVFSRFHLASLLVSFQLGLLRLGSLSFLTERTSDLSFSLTWSC